MKRLYCFVGLPCSGKSYAAKVIAKHVGGTYIAAGDIARALATPETWKVTEKNDLFPEEDKLRAEIARQVHGASTDVVILDGSPRFEGQAHFLADEFWEYHPVIIEVSVGDWSVLPQRAKLRARDSRDTDPKEFMKRLATASELMEKAMAVLRQRLIACYTLMSSDDNFMIKEFERIRKLNESNNLHSRSN